MNKQLKRTVLTLLLATTVLAQCSHTDSTGWPASIEPPSYLSRIMFNANGLTNKESSPYREDLTEYVKIHKRQQYFFEWLHTTDTKPPLEECIENGATEFKPRYGNELMTYCLHAFQMTPTPGDPFMRCFLEIGHADVLKAELLNKLAKKLSEQNITLAKGNDLVYDHVKFLYPISMIKQITIKIVKPLHRALCANITDHIANIKTPELQFFVAQRIRALLQSNPSQDKLMRKPFTMSDLQKHNKIDPQELLNTIDHATQLVVDFENNVYNLAHEEESVAPVGTTCKGPKHS